MALAHPSLNTIAGAKPKRKFKNAEEARRFRELESSWADLKGRWKVEQQSPKKKPSAKLEYSLTTPVGRETAKYGSVDTGHKGAVSKKEVPQYTGTAMLGIGQMAKSNAVPVFSQDEAIAIARMRRG